MTTMEKIITLARHYFTETLDEDCQKLEDSMTDAEIQTAIDLANDLANLDD